SDHLLRGGIAPGPALSIMEALHTVPFQPVLWGSLLGYAVLPLALLGLWPLYRALEPAGRRLALVPVVLFGYSLTLFAGYHYAAVLYALGFQAADAASNSLLTEQLMQVNDGALTVIGIPLTIASLWIIGLILSGKTLYARWMAIVSPLLTQLISPLVKMIPSPYGGYIVPGSMTIVFVVFFALALWVSWPSSKPGVSSERL
ncbi:MAG: DUF6796 family protein, partial [Pseudomonadota bacterium]